VNRFEWESFAFETFGENFAKAHIVIDYENAFHSEIGISGSLPIVADDLL
jgi:hypothetical protein